MLDTILKPMKSLFGSNPAKKDDAKNEILSVEDIYTPLSVAKEEIWRRWNDKELRKKVEEFLGNELCSVFKHEPKAIIFRNIATPNFELQIAHETAKLMGLNLIVIEYNDDKFCTRNRDKLHLGKMMFFDDKHRLQIISKNNVISIKEEDNKCFSDIKTLWGEDFISFHHRILKNSEYGDVEFFDASFYKKTGLDVHGVYLKILSACTQPAVLLESFLIKSDKNEKKFTEQVIIPAFLEIEKKFGFKPMIVPLLDADGEGSVLWQYYAHDIESHLNFKK